MTQEDFDKILASASCTPEEREQIKTAYNFAVNAAIARGKPLGEHVVLALQNQSVLDKFILLVNKREENKAREKVERN